MPLRSTKTSERAHLDLCLLRMLFILSISVFSAFFFAATAWLYVHLPHAEILFVLMADLKVNYLLILSAFKKKS